MELGKLLIKINSGGTPDKGELAEIVEYLECVQSDLCSNSHISFDDVYESVLVLGRAHAKEHRRLIEYYLESKDPTTVALVLEILCLYWNEVNEYLERVIHFALGVSWDSDGDVRLTSIKILGEYLHAVLQEKKKIVVNGSSCGEFPQRDREVLRLLLHTFEDEDVDSFLRTQAYLSMCRAYGKELDELPSEYLTVDPETEDSAIDWQMVFTLREIAA